MLAGGTGQDSAARAGQSSADGVPVGSLAWVPLPGRATGPDADWLGTDPVSGRMRSFAFTVYDVPRQLSAVERQELRRAGQLPGWFLPAVYRRRRELRHGRLR